MQWTTRNMNKWSGFFFSFMTINVVAWRCAGPNTIPPNMGFQVIKLSCNILHVQKKSSTLNEENWFTACEFQFNFFSLFHSVCLWCWARWETHSPETQYKISSAIWNKTEPKSNNKSVLAADVVAAAATDAWQNDLIKIMHFCIVSFFTPFS